MYPSRNLNFLNVNTFSPENLWIFSGKSINDVLISVDTCQKRKLLVISIFLDVKEAFDSINHKLLISKLEYCDTRGVTMFSLVSDHKLALDSFIKIFYILEGIFNFQFIYSVPIVIYN